MHVGGAHVESPQTNHSVMVLTRELALLPKKLKFLNPKKLHFVTVNILERASSVMVPIRHSLRIRKTTYSISTVKSHMLSIFYTEYLKDHLS